MENNLIFHHVWLIVSLDGRQESSTTTMTTQLEMKRAVPKHVFYEPPKFPERQTERKTTTRFPFLPNQQRIPFLMEDFSRGVLGMFRRQLFDKKIGSMS
jgi:hypothetical protein